MGLAIGSFLNVVAYRVPLGLSVVQPPSACPNCDNQIRWYDNIPVLVGCVCAESVATALNPSLLAIRSSRLLPDWLLAWLPGWLAHGAPSRILVLCWNDHCAGVTDLDHKRLPDRIVFTGTGLTVALFIGGSIIENQTDQLTPAFIGGAATCVVLCLFMVTPGGFGFGDVKLSFSSVS